MRVLVRAFWHARGRLAETGADRALERYLRLAARAERFFRRRDAS